MASWDEVRQLAANFQQVQSTENTQRLSDRNCVDLVKKLAQLKFVDLIHTNDGREYVTPEYLSREILDEITVHQGRINIVDLQKILDVDLRHIENTVSHLVNNDRSLEFVLGNIISSSYRSNLISEINSLLQENGRVMLSTLVQAYDLPLEFISCVISSNIGKKISGIVDPSEPDVVFTDDYLKEHSSLLEGFFTAVIKPTTLHDGFKILDEFPEKLYYNILIDLIKSDKISGKIVGGHHLTAVFIPTLYSYAQFQWVSQFFRENFYLDFDTMKNIGIPDPRSFVLDNMNQSELIWLNKCVINHLLVDTIIPSIDEALSNGSYLNVYSFINFEISKMDLNKLLTLILKDRSDDFEIFCTSYVTSSQFIEKMISYFDDLIKEKANIDLDKNIKFLRASEFYQPSVTSDSSQSSRKDNRIKTNSSRSGKWTGGTQGREVKKKTTKNKYMKHRSNVVDKTEVEELFSSHSGLKFIPVDEISEILSQKFAVDDEENDSFFVEIAEHIHPRLRNKFEEFSRELYATRLKLNAKETEVLNQQDPLMKSPRSIKQKSNDLSDSINEYWTNIRLYFKGIESISDSGGEPELRKTLEKFLLNSLCIRVANMSVNALAADQMASVSDYRDITDTIRFKLINALPASNKIMFMELNRTLSGKSVEDFMVHFQTICSPAHLGIHLQKSDKKKDRQIVYGFRQNSLETLRDYLIPHESETLEADEHFHEFLFSKCLAVLIYAFTQSMVLFGELLPEGISMIPAKTFPSILVFLKTYMDEESMDILKSYNQLLFQLSLARQDGKENDVLNIKQQLIDSLPKVIGLAVAVKKPAKKE